MEKKAQGIGELSRVRKKSLSEPRIMAVEAAEKGDFFRFIYYMPHEMETKKNSFLFNAFLGVCTGVR